MATSPYSYRPRLYRKRARAVTLACLAAITCWFCAQQANAQFAKKRKPDTGPRAVGLLKIDAKGRVQLIPVAIRIDGKFYDAGAYKADPVPMALQPGTVYEGVKAGVSQGLFTSAGAARTPEGWFADGKWRSNTEIEADKARAKAETEKKAQKASEDPVNGGPPRLTRPGDSPPKSTQAPEAQKTPPAASVSPSPAATPSASSTSPPKDSPAQDSPSQDDTDRPVLHRQATSEPSDETKVTPSSASPAKDSPAEGSPAKDSPSEADAGHPVLRRQAPSETSHEQTKATFGDTKPESIKPESVKDAAKGEFQWVPAISDAAGPEPRPYAYSMKPDEEAAFLKKMLALAGPEVTARAASGKVEEPKSKASDKPALSKAEGNVRPTRSPQFQNVQLRVFDLSSSNEPVLILTANATVASRGDVVFMIALVAREDIYGDLHKVSAMLTDSQHLDALPKYEFIDAVDADGDGRAELLFRLTSDAGSAYAIYSVIGDRLWPLFEGKPGT